MGWIITQMEMETKRNSDDSLQRSLPLHRRLDRRRFFGIGRASTPGHIAVFTRQLATMLRFGLPLLRSLEVLIRQEKSGPFKEVVEGLADTIRNGNNLSDGLRLFPDVFSDLYINMTRAGEAGGVLDTVLLRLAEFLEKSVRTLRRIKAAMIYPVIVVAVAFIIVGLLMVFVIPRFQSIYHDLLRGASLPTLTQWTIDTSTLLKDYWWALIVVIPMVIYLYKWIRRTESGGRFIDRFFLNMPRVGELVSKLAIARFSRTFATLLESGVPLLKALLITRDVVGNRVIMDAMNTVHDRVRDGESIATTLEQAGVFPDMVTSMIDVGEETGQLAQMLHRIADAYEEEVDHAVAAVTSAIEPIMIVLLAVFVGTIVIALFLPVINIIENLSVG